MKDIHRQPFTNLATYTSRISCSNIQRYGTLLFLIVLLVLGQQNVSLSAHDSNQRTQNGEKQGSAITIRQVFNSNLSWKEEVSKIIEILTSESVDESLNRLHEIGMYIRNIQLHMELPPSGIPLDASVGQRDIVAIMGNRRFLKVIHELSQLPKDKAAALVSREITSSLS